MTEFDLATLAAAVQERNVWTSGEAELDTGDLTTGASTSTHYELATPQDLTSRLDDLTKHLNP
ncbi:hypothetical protein GCM10022254_37380 [Actinomadura meridiana]|uniref:Uncharacterized protein n=1 Tax=Actinomadura meridiana TaxID=559626 RepID=A0ABP8C546_9ACTN